MSIANNESTSEPITSSISGAEISPTDYIDRHVTTKASEALISNMKLSPSRQAILRQGAELALSELISGDWTFADEHQSDMMKVLLERSVANAERQGITLD